MISQPTTAALKDDIVSQIELQLEQDIPLLPKAFIRVLAAVLSGAMVVLYRYCSWIFLQMFVAYASNKEVTVFGKKLVPLVEFGRLIGVGDPIAATRAELDITVTVTNQTGTLGAGTPLLFLSTGVIYTVVYDVPLDSSTITARIRADNGQKGSDGSGTIGNLQVDDTVQFANPLANIARTAAVAAVQTTAADAESWDAYRARIIRRFQNPPQGGAYADYQEWGEGVAGILHVYPYAGDPGEVDVYAEATIESSDDDGIPDADQLADVLAAINLDLEGLASRRPVLAAVNVLPISRRAFNYMVTGLTASDEAAAKDALETAVDDWLRSREPYIDGLSALPRADRITQGAVSGVADDAVSALGATFTELTLDDGPAYTLGIGEKAKAGTPTYV
jgi:uncharacterized phage protein gp47/JayE